MEREHIKPDLSALRIDRDDDEGSGTRRGLRVVLLGTVIILVAVNRPWQAGAGFALLLSGLPAHSLFTSRRTAAEPISQGASQ